MSKEVTITRVFDAPRELVFKAWTDPKLLEQWWGPEYFSVPYCEVDVRPGGVFRVHMRGPDGVIYPGGGMYHEIVEPERLVITTTAFEDEAGIPKLEVRNTITFAELEAGKTKLTLHALVITAAPEVQAALAGMEQGWKQSFDKLNRFLVKV
jgi:uncharacterized protein YndB with AHSA1/START domain